MAPHGFNPVTRAKSPLGVMLPIFRVAWPELVSVITFGPFVIPTFTGVTQVREVGVSVTAGPEAPSHSELDGRLMAQRSRHARDSHC